VLPGLILLALWACSRLKLRAAELGAGRATASAVGVCCVLAMAVPAFVTSFDPGVTSGAGTTSRQVVLRGTAVSATGGGEISAMSQLCSAIGPNASVLFTDSATANAFEPAVRGICGDPAASAFGGSLAVGQLMSSIDRTGRRPVLLGSSRSRLVSSGVVPRLVVDLGTWQDAQVLTGPPAGTWPVTYTVWMASPLGGPVSG
jgi:hypothetical protein